MSRVVSLVVSLAVLLAIPAHLHAASRSQTGTGGTATAPDAGIIRPPEHLDPGITRPTPVLPPQSMPVIHPPRLPSSPRKSRRERPGNGADRPRLVVPR